MNIVIGGHVDHGKSTIVGRLLADTGSLPVTKLEQVRSQCERSGKPFEYAFLIDALRDERAQGITIDMARVFFQTAAREYLLIDAPGHIEFLKNLVTGAARAEAAVLVVDAKEGMQENSRRHGYMMAMLGIRHVAVAVNKMDLVGYDRERFRDIECEYRAFLAPLGIQPRLFVPVSARAGDNLTSRSSRTPWYSGPTILEVLDTFPEMGPAVDQPFRLPVQDVYKFTAQQDDRRIVVGTVAAGTAAVGDEVVFYPSGKKSTIKSFEAFSAPTRTRATPGDAIGLTLREQIYLTRGEIATLGREQAPRVARRVRASLFWLGRNPLAIDKDYLLKCGAAKVPVRVEQIERVINASDLSAREGETAVGTNEVADCVLVSTRAIAFDLADEIEETSRFVIVDDYEIMGGGIFREALADEQAAIREKVLVRNSRWASSLIPIERRAARFAQRPTLLLITGERHSDRKGLARALESELFDEGRAVYFLGIGSLLYGVDADIGRDPEDRHEHLRRLAEVAHLMLEAGLILIATAAALNRAEIELIQTTLPPDRIETVWMGDTGTTDFDREVHCVDAEAGPTTIRRVKAILQDKGIIFRS
jgi:bifunctional enzyme CysN/CysC